MSAIVRMAFAALSAACENLRASSDFSAAAALSIMLSIVVACVIGFYLRKTIDARLLIPADAPTRDPLKCRCANCFPPPACYAAESIGPMRVARCISRKWQREFLVRSSGERDTDPLSLAGYSSPSEETAETGRPSTADLGRCAALPVRAGSQIRTWRDRY